MFIMMKRKTKRALTAAGILILALLAVWGTVYRFRIPRIKGETLLTYVPARLDGNTPLGAVAGFRNPKDIYTQLKETNFYSALEEFIASDEGGQDGSPAVEEKVLLNLLGRQTLAAAYGNPQGEVYYLLLAEIRDITGFKQRIYERFREEENVVGEHAGEKIEKYDRDIFYSVAEGLFMASNSVKLIEKSIDLKKAGGRAENFNAVYGWVEEQMQPDGDAFVFTAGEKLTEIIKRAYPTLEYAGPGAGTAANVYREIYFREGFVVHSRTPQTAPSSRPSRARSIEAMPPRPAIMQANAHTNFTQNVEFLIERNIISPEFSARARDIAPLLGEESSMALMTSPSEGEIIPGILLFAEGGREAYGKLRDLIKESFDISFTESSFGGVEFEYGRLPLFFTGIDLSLGMLKAGGKEFIVLASSREVFRRAVKAAAGEEENFAGSKSYKSIEEHIPSRYSSLYYTDMDSLARSIRPLLALLGARRRLSKFLAVEPFSWIGPSGGATVLEEDYRKAYIYIPARDLEKEQWIELFSGASDFLND